MAAFYNSGTGRPRSLSNESDTPPKRIMAPSGMRLSVIMENTIDQKSVPRKASKEPFSKASTLVNFPRLSEEKRIGPGSSFYSYDISSSDRSGTRSPRLPERVRNNGFLTRKGGWKRFMIFVVILVLCIVAIVVGVTVGLRQQQKQENANSQNSDAVPAATSGSPTAAVGSSPTSTSVPNGFPVGTYSFTTFLDTVTTDCTSNPNTWTCFPYTIYNSNKVQAMSTFNWVISEASKGSFVASSIQNPFAINFQNAGMKMIDQGGQDERYQFQISMDKSVVPTTAITDDGSSSTCYFNSTTFTAYLYTKRAKDYPTQAQVTSNSTYQAWPYAVRVEQTVAGGNNVPNCYQTTNGQLGARVGNLTAEDPTTLCSCLYRNYLTK